MPSVIIYSSIYKNNNNNTKCLLIIIISSILYLNKKNHIMLNFFHILHALPTRLLYKSKVFVNGC